MSTNYPGGIDSYSTHSDATNEVVHASTINNLQDAVVALETTLGTNPQGAAATVSARIAAAGGGTYFREDFFTGANGLRSFTLAATPLMYTLEVFIDGVKKRPGIDYTWDSATAVSGLNVATSTTLVAIRYATATASPGATALDALVSGTPGSFTGLAAWWQATDLSGSDLATVTSWPDHTASIAFDSIGAGAVLRTGLTGVAGGKAVEPNGGALTIAASVMSGWTAATAVIVAKAGGSSGQELVGPWWMGGNDTMYWPYIDNNIYDGAFTSTRFQSSSSVSSNHPGAAYRRYAVTHAGNSSAWNMYYNGAVIKTNASTGFTIPASPRITGSGFSGRVAELILYNQALSSADIASLDTWLANRHS